MHKNQTAIHFTERAFYFRGTAKKYYLCIKDENNTQNSKVVTWERITIYL